MFVHKQTQPSDLVYIVLTLETVPNWSWVLMVDHLLCAIVLQMETMYKNAHAKIREDPTAKPKPKKEVQTKQ